MEEQLETMVDEGLLSRGSVTSGGSGASRTAEEELVPNARCVCCGEGMAREVLPRFSRGYGITVLVVGLLLATFMSLLLGLPMVVIGAYMGAANRAVWTCQACGAVVDRIAT